LEELKAVLSNHPGDEPVFLNVGQTTLRLPAEFNVNSDRGLLGELVALLGPGAVIREPEAAHGPLGRPSEHRLVAVSG